jgi:17beta-estradiol 17-dehydrogenase / very-long-chain 3-oxoacyl-CoA reductase
MLARKHHRSAFINIGSGIGQLSSPLTGIYPATKEFLRIFSRSLDLEQGQNNLDVLCVKPLGVITNMMSFAKHDWTMVTPSAVVTPAIQALGHQKETFGAV